MHIFRGVLGPCCSEVLMILPPGSDSCSDPKAPRAQSPLGAMDGQLSVPMPHSATAVELGPRSGSPALPSGASGQRWAFSSLPRAREGVTLGVTRLGLQPRLPFFVASSSRSYTHSNLQCDLGSTLVSFA